MKKLFTLFALVLAMSLSASNINLHLTGCTADPSNPTEYTDEDYAGVTLNFIAEPGYTLVGWEVIVKHGETVIPNNDWSSEIGYVYPDPAYGVFIYWADDITEDFDVTVICPLDESNLQLPEVFSPATFEEFTMPANSVYRPSSFAVGNNYMLSGGCLFATQVQDWGGGFMGYTEIQVVNYKNQYLPADGSDAYLASCAAGAAEGDNFAICNVMGLFTEVKVTPTILSGMYVTNTQFARRGFTTGDGYARAFHQGDWFKLTITGLRNNQVVGSVDYYLADYRTATFTYAEDWQWVDLTLLGEVDALQFSLDGTDKGNYGLNTASYFCFDNLGGAAPSATGVQNSAVLPEAKKMIQNGQLIIVREGKTYNVLGF